MNLKLLLLFFLCYACSSPQTEESSPDSAMTKAQKKGIPQLQSRLDSLSLTGSVLVYDAAQNTYFSNNFPRTEIAYLPASTFKIPNSIIGLETGIMRDTQHLFEWDGAARSLPSWEKDLSLKEAFHASCVPCYRSLARDIGLERMQAWTEKLQFGKMVVTEETLDLFWLDGPSRISQMEQIDFLARFYFQKLPISPRTYALMKDMMVREKTEDYQLVGKTGLSIANDRYNGWFVGYVEKGEKVYFFATNLEPKTEAQNESMRPQRIELSLAALRILGILPQR